MTREEAIGKWIYPAIATMWDEKKCNEILEALEQEPSEDAISRQAVLDAMYKLCDTGETLEENPWRDNPHIDAVVETIEQLPPVRPQPKTGHWILTVGHWILTVEDWNKWECSHCGYTKRTDVHVMLGYNYCPNCGTKMIEPQESEE